MSGQVPSARRRILKAAGVLIVNVILWFVVPYYVGALISKQVPTSALAVPTFIYEFGAIITALQVIVALTEGMTVSVPFVSASYLVTAYYLWAATNGGNLSLSANGTSIASGFALLVDILIVLSIWGAIRAPIGFMIKRGAAEGQGPPLPSSA